MSGVQAGPGGGAMANWMNDLSSGPRVSVKLSFSGGPWSGQEHTVYGPWPPPQEVQGSTGYYFKESKPTDVFKTLSGRTAHYEWIPR